MKWVIYSKYTSDQWLKPILIIGARLSPADFNLLVIPSIITLFKSTDRNIRLALCEKMSLYIDNITAEDAIKHIKSKEWEFFVDVKGDKVKVIVVNRNWRDYIKTQNDGDNPNNLLSLESCPIR